jgi:hypothetical protein
VGTVVGLAITGPRTPVLLTLLTRRDSLVFYTPLAGLQGRGLAARRFALLRAVTHFLRQQSILRCKSEFLLAV